jgi:hypothetical protein
MDRTMTEPTGTPGSPPRAGAYGLLSALAGGAIIVVLAGPLGVGAGLLVAAAAIGRLVGLSVLEGARGTLGVTSRVGLSVTLSVLAVAVGETGTWMFARAEGGILDLPDYLAQVHGWIVPGQVVLAATVAWWTARRPAP